MQNYKVAQSINLIKINEQDETLDDPDIDFVGICTFAQYLDPERNKYVWIQTIDPYGTTTFNTKQIPYLINELKLLAVEDITQKTKDEIREAINYLNNMSNFEFARLLGD